MEFIDSDFNKLLYNFRGVSLEGDPFNDYPELLKYKEFQSSFLPLNRVCVLRYITYVYDENSPFRDIPGLYERKRLSAIEAGFELGDNEEFSKEVEDLIIGNNKKITDMIVRYIQLHYNRKFTYYIYLEDQFEKILKDGISGSENIEKMKKLQKELESVYDEMLYGDTKGDLLKELYKFVQKERLGISPEEISEKIKNGVEPVTFEEIS